MGNQSLSFNLGSEKHISINYIYVFVMLRYLKYEYLPNLIHGLVPLPFSSPLILILLSPHCMDIAILIVIACVTRSTPATSLTSKDTDTSAGDGCCSLLYPGGTNTSPRHKEGNSNNNHITKKQARLLLLL